MEIGNTKKCEIVLFIDNLRIHQETIMKRSTRMSQFWLNFIANNSKRPRKTLLSEIFCHACAVAVWVHVLRAGLALPD